ncbi:Dps family protein [Streptococcus pneumoniae]
MNTTKQAPAADVATFSKTVADKLPQTKAVLNQAVADLYTARIALHQVHWYMRGQGFLVWHPKMDEYMDSLNEHLDEISERLITLGGAPYSTLSEFIKHSKIEEEVGSFEHTMEENLTRVLSIFCYLVSLFQEGLDATDEEGDDVTNGIFSDAKGEIEKHIWMIAAELGQAPGL